MRLFFEIVALTIFAIVAAAFSQVHRYPAPYGSVVLIQHGDVHGTGVYLGHGFVLTAAHIANDTVGKGPLKVAGVEAKPLWFDKDMDVGLLLVQGLNRPSADLACGKADPVIGDELEAVGNPSLLQNIHVRGTVAGEPKQYQVVDLHETSFIFSGLLAPGMSGGPLFDREGKIAGIASATLMGGFGSPMPLGFVIPRSVICGALKRYDF